jgi:hypothetical protein
VSPRNADAIRAVTLETRVIADALVEGRPEGREAMVTRATGPEIEPEPEVAPQAPAPPPAVAEETIEVESPGPAPEPDAAAPAMAAEGADQENA